ncbi:serine kinase [Oscillatoria sp. FACHB-1406]|uniref:serine kinase n=1 Tax=Oscillatoria sp. FACHB-1406 TaxID=2692846 RepID=UPI0016821BE2|nr:serine kinase [Oscillatoria sp. FACHB-1406]MBD2578883.1 serine kinase [Oscillatoria sp. FACHB-1406]
MIANHSIPDTTPQDSLAFFESIEELFQKAVTSVGGTRDRFYCIAGFKIRLQFATEALIPDLTPALEHLAVEPFSEADLTVCLWDSHSTHTPMPPPPWKRYQHHPKRGEILGFNSDRIHTSFQWGSYALSLLDRDRNLGIYWVETAAQLPYWEGGSPLRTIFNVWFSQRGIQLVHGGAVGHPHGGALLVGKGGSGKSTTALACLSSDLFYASDDYSLVSCDPNPTAFSIYSTGKKNADDLERLPFLATAISNRDRLESEKAVYFLNQHFPEKIISRFPLKAILIPRITGKTETTVTPTSVAAALASLVPSTTIQLPGAGKEACKIMMQVAGKVPSYYLELGTDIEQVPQTISALLERL